VFGRDFVLQVLDARFLKLDDVAAFDANQVIVVRGVIGKFVASKSIAEAALVGNPTFREELECPVDSCIPDARVARPNLSQKLFDADVAFRAKERLDDKPSLIGRAQAFFEHVRMQHRAEVFELGGAAIQMPSHGRGIVAHRAPQRTLGLDKHVFGQVLAQANVGLPVPAHRFQ